MIDKIVGTIKNAPKISATLGGITIVSGEDGGGASIDVTAEVGQTIVVEEVDASGKPTKWKAADYQPRTHWSETGITEILPETTIAIDPEIGAGGYAESIGLTAGNNYTVRWNGTEYSCTAQDFYEQDDEGNPLKVGVCMGNVDLMMGGEGTGEPFVILEPLPEFAAESPFSCVIYAVDGSESVVLSIVGEKVVYHTIQREYLPESKPCTIDAVFEDTSTLQLQLDLETSSKLVDAILNDDPIYINSIATIHANTIFERLNGVPKFVQNSGSGQLTGIVTIKDYINYFLSSGVSVNEIPLQLTAWSVYRETSLSISINRQTGD